MLRRIRLLAAALLLGFTAVPVQAQQPAGAQAPTPSELAFGVISTESTTSLRTQWEPFFADMSKAIGVPVKGFYATDYAGIIEGMRFNKVQLAWYGNASAIQAVDRADGEVFMQKVFGDGTLGYNSVLIVPKDSPIKSLDDLLKSPGKYTFGNGDPNSTSGFLIPSYYVWAKNNIDIRKHFTRTVSGSHEINLLAVANKQVDVATCNTEDMTKIQRNHPDKVAAVREIWRSPIIPADPIVWRKDLDPALKAKIAKFFTDYGAAPGTLGDEQKKILVGINVQRFVASTDAQLLPVRQVALFKDRTKIEQDEALNADEKAKKIAEIDAKLRELDKKVAELSAKKG
ncbi:phosphonate ABC transporter substrate-binding protein [Roseiterribacter gracilis]|uniref:Phosphonate ABC transporter substrate-binding protein n=1 Tax=Roseiterribacter gracilis TaxID=2812848 RepID=A0A8S8X5P8_9PROT|nr:phosphonate ABC transporter substrate-binding protein [Rhodospirillales bacterium TMPK1]